MKRGEVVNIELVFTEIVLGTAPKNPETYRDYIASKIAKRKDLTEEEKKELGSDEIEKAYRSLNATEDRGWTTFLRDEKGWFVFDYWIRGFFKTAFAVLQETGDLPKIPAYKNKLDRHLFIFGQHNGSRHERRKVYFDTVLKGGKTDLDVLERPLRAMTPQGPRTTLARSDVIPIDSKVMFQVELLKNKAITVEMVRESLEYGDRFGMGQWASGGWGTFVVGKFEPVTE